MDKDQLVRGAYEAFLLFEKPEHPVNFEHCEECASYDSMLSSVSRQDLSIEQVGTVCWGPVPTFTPEAMAYYMPRLIELALSGVLDKDRDPYFIFFVNSVSEGPSSGQYSLFGAPQRRVLASALGELKRRYGSRFDERCYGDTLEQAISRWGPP